MQAVLINWMDIADMRNPHRIKKALSQKSARRTPEDFSIQQEKLMTKLIGSKDLLTPIATIQTSTDKAIALKNSSLGFQ